MLPLDVEVKPIPGFPHYYASADGRIWSEYRGWKTKPYFEFGLWMKPQFYKPYLRVTLSKNGKQYRLKIHRLVLEAFVGPRPPGHVACHKDGDKLNNCLDNLGWVTRKECYAYWKQRQM